MKRRKFVVGAGGTAIGGSSLIGSGAFTRTESHREISIEVADDPDAYLGLDGCPGSPNNSYTETDGEGHLTVEMDPGNPTDAGGQGINSDSLSAFDDVFQICNQGKQEVCVWIDAQVREDLLMDHDTSEPVIDFYVLDGDGEPRSIRGVEQAVSLPVGECYCVGIRTYSKYLSEGDQLIEDNQILINADATVDDCPVVNGGDIPPGEEPQNGQAISFVAFCGDGLSASDYSVSITGRNEDGEPTSVSYSGPTPSNIVVFGAARLFNTSGPTITLSGDEVEWEGGMNATEQRPPSPCKDGNCGPKFDYKSASDMFEAVEHQDQCVDESSE